MQHEHHLEKWRAECQVVAAPTKDQRREFSETEGGVGSARILERRGVGGTRSLSPHAQCSRASRKFSWKKSGQVVQSLSSPDTSRAHGVQATGRVSSGRVPRLPTLVATFAAGGVAKVGREPLAAGVPLHELGHGADRACRRIRGERRHGTRTSVCAAQVRRIDTEIVRDRCAAAAW